LSLEQKTSLSGVREAFQEKYLEDAKDIGYSLSVGYGADFQGNITLQITLKYMPPYKGHKEDESTREVLKRLMPEEFQYKNMLFKVKYLPNIKRNNAKVE